MFWLWLCHEVILVTYDPGRIYVRYESEIYLALAFIWQTDTLVLLILRPYPCESCVMCNSLGPVENQVFLCNIDWNWKRVMGGVDMNEQCACIFWPTFLYMYWPAWQEKKGGGWWVILTLVECPAWSVFDLGIFRLRWPAESKCRSEILMHSNSIFLKDQSRLD